MAFRNGAIEEKKIAEAKYLFVFNIVQTVAA